MNVRQVTVQAVDGTSEPATLIECPQCKGSAFRLLLIRDHNHLQCVACSTSFCQLAGQCGAGTYRDPS